MALLYTDHMQRSNHSHWDTTSSVILTATLLTAAYRLSLTRWAPGLDVAYTSALLGCGLGLMLGASRFGRTAVLALSAAYTTIIIPWLLTTIIEIQPQALATLGNIGGRLEFALGQVAAQTPVQDPLLFLTAMTVLFWVMSVHATFFMVRQRSILNALLPASLGIILIQYYDLYYSARLWVVGFFFFLALLLTARVNLMKQWDMWRAERVFTSPETTYDLTTSALIATAIFVLTAWALPQLGSPLEAARTAWQRLTDPFDSFSERISDALAPLRGTVGNTVPQFGATLDLGRNISSSPNILFTVSVPNLDVPRYYWRGRIYDTYTNGQWRNAQETLRAFSPRDSQDLPLPYTNERLTGLFVFSLQSDLSNLVTPSEPLWFSRSATLVTATAEPFAYDFLSASPTEMLRGGEFYEVRAAIANPTLSDLRTAGTNYPDWVTARYLQLPDDFSPRIVDLARRITASATNPYDQAQSITDYLRRTITYAETVATSPPQTDPLEWFLFETQSGFCNYYATSQVLMLRVVGIPARLAIGYAQGNTAERGTYIVRARDYHAWPEVYFPGIGWVEFEPTSSQSALTRPLGQVLSSSSGVPAPRDPPMMDDAETGQDKTEQDKIDLFEQDPAATNTARAQRLQAQIATWLTSLAIGAGVGIALLRLSRQRPLLMRIPLAIQSGYERVNLPPPRWIKRWLGWMSMTTIERAFQSINYALRLLGSPPPVAATPAERSAALIRLLPEAQTEIIALTAEHEASLFTPNPGNTKRAWQLQWRIYLTALVYTLTPYEETPAP